MLWSYIIDITYIGLPIIILAGIIASCVSQIGDLSMSAIKRKQGIKDFGRLFPGHGGVLDRFDSVLAVSTVVTIIFAVLNNCITKDTYDKDIAEIRDILTWKTLEESAD